MPTNDPVQLSLFNLNKFYVPQNPDSKSAEIQKKASRAGETLQKHTEVLRMDESELNEIEKEMVNPDGRTDCN